jgi:hypothetical protein
MVTIYARNGLQREGATKGMGYEGHGNKVIELIFYYVYQMMPVLSHRVMTVS